MEGRFDWGRYDFGTFRRRDVLTMGRFDCKAFAVTSCFRSASKHTYNCNLQRINFQYPKITKPACNFNV